MIAGRQALAAEARAHVARAIELLARPTATTLDQSRVEFAAAGARLEQIQRQAGDGDAETNRAVRAAIEGLRSDLQLVRLLLAHAWEFRARCTGQAGYTSKGELSALSGAAIRWAFEA
jgi:hypothetical protein